ncbi:hypothetical protein E2C01_009489 [Portunus trituberculatus]|uniref:Uncharacterized protein n=1 Tax=Portunus trituberculatus TaxID=210409 RepID=A0A5B7D5W8_PORTR|nr:hypothetical protein [Portunus trituberculatus]
MPRWTLEAGLAVTSIEGLCSAVAHDFNHFVWRDEVPWTVTLASSPSGHNISAAPRRVPCSGQESCPGRGSQHRTSEDNQSGRACWPGHTCLIPLTAHPSSIHYATSLGAY